MYLFLQNAVQNISTWMTSSVQFKNNEGLSFVTDISEEGWIMQHVREDKEKKGIAK